MSIYTITATVLLARGSQTFEVDADDAEEALKKWKWGHRRLRSTDLTPVTYGELSVSEEVWKPLPFKGYDISTLGTVRCWIPLGWSSPDYSREPRVVTGYHCKRSGGYLQYTFQPRGNSRRVRKMGHVLVMETFVGPRPGIGTQVRHLNGNPLDNRLVNLVWGTAKEDAEDKQRLGTQVHGEKQGQAKLTNKEAEKIADLHKHGMRVDDIAKKLNMDKRTISRVVTGKSYGKVTGIVYKKKWTWKKSVSKE